MSKSFCEMRSKIQKEILSDPTRHWNWQGGRTALYDAIRNSESNKQWKQQVKERDAYTCQQCGSSIGNTLESHHIKSFSIILMEFLDYYKNLNPLKDIVKLLELSKDWNDFWDLDNGQCVCKNCHKKTKSYSIKVNKLRRSK